MLRMLDPEQRAQIRRQKEAAILRREQLIERARAILNRAKLAGEVTWDKSNVAYVMRPETARFLVDNRPEIFKHRPEDPENYFLLDDVQVYFSRELEPDQIVLAHEWWPVLDEPTDG